MQLDRPTPCSTTGWLAAPPSANSSPRSAEPSLLNSRTNICTALTVLMSGKSGEVQDHIVIVIKKPKKTGSDYYNYKGFFSIVFLALVDAEYRFLWIDCVSSGFYSDTQNFNRGYLREKIEDGSLGLPALEHLGDGGPDLHYFFWVTCLCLDALDGQTLQLKTTDQGRKNSQLQNLQGPEGGGKRLWNLNELLQGTTGHHGAKAKGCQRHCVYVCVVGQHAEDTPEWDRQGHQPQEMM